MHWVAPRRAPVAPQQRRVCNVCTHVLELHQPELAQRVDALVRPLRGNSTGTGRASLETGPRPPRQRARIIINLEARARAAPVLTACRWRGTTTGPHPGPRACARRDSEAVQRTSGMNSWHSVMCSERHNEPMVGKGSYGIEFHPFGRCPFLSHPKLELKGTWPTNPKK